MAFGEEITNQISSYMTVKTLDIKRESGGSGWQWNHSGMTHKSSYA